MNEKTFSSRLFMLCAAAALLLKAGPTSADAGSKKKIISYGWNPPDTRYIRQHWREMDESPLNGTGIIVAIDRTRPTSGDGATENMLNWKLFSSTSFALEHFRGAIDDLQSAKWHKLTDNFLVAVIVSSGQDQGFSWFDDERWKVILNNWRVFATIAKKGGCKGIFIDPEQYGRYFFSYPEMNGRDARSYAEYTAQVRKRGRELMQVSREAFPNALYLTMWAHSWLTLHPSERFKPPAKSSYGLLPAFVDGLLEASPAATRFYDMCEFAYGYKDRTQFLQAFHDIIQAATLSSVPRDYRAKMRVGFGLWLDYEQTKWNEMDVSQNYFTPEGFQKSLHTALETSDEYVWIYSHAPRFFPPARLPEAYMEAIVNAQRSSSQ